MRLEETLESIREVKQLLAEMPDGPIRRAFDDALPPGLEGISAVEAPRGEVIHYVMTGEDARPVPVASARPDLRQPAGARHLAARG